MITSDASSFLFANFGFVSKEIRWLVLFIYGLCPLCSRRFNIRVHIATVKLQDHRLTDLENGIPDASPQTSISSSKVSGALARRAVSALRRALTPNNTICEMPTGSDVAGPESILWRGRSNAGPDSSHHVRISEPGFVMHQAPCEMTMKPLSDLAGRLKPTTEIVSVQVGTIFFKSQSRFSESICSGYWYWYNAIHCCIFEITLRNFIYVDL